MVTVLWLQNSSTKEMSRLPSKPTLTASNRTAINQIFEPMTQRNGRARGLKDAWENSSFYDIFHANLTSNIKTNVEVENFSRQCYLSGHSVPGLSW